MGSDFIALTVKGVIPTSGGCAVFLGTESKTFVIHMDAGMGQTIRMHLQNTHSERPLTHDLIAKIFMSFGITLEHVIINKIEDATFYSRIILRMKNELGMKVIELDARPSDAIVLALQGRRPIFVLRGVFEQVEDISSILSKLMEENRGEDGEGFEDGNPGRG